MKQIEIQRTTQLPPQIQSLALTAAEEGYRFLTRLVAEWNSGANRFDAPGECFMTAVLGGCLIGIGGVSVDPYVQNRAGRLRRVYVLPSARRQGIGRVLVEQLVDHAARHFSQVRLFTDTAEGDAFYRRCGFKRAAEDNATHVMIFNL
ncbi:GNAT family N-acetyltransferase [Pseudomonas viridiflava]|uniref:GNAT family N-acetyltransferase n=1 Tax=Pseudomonas viridiflava TaxID=33069 RepID=UPI0015E45B04|nr:GNAT family N-acetyltransferase [Pseudomonas viridiflava]MBA1228190.1 GNAT family N-acetyltransferase [Pseudomonas viridiflava]